MNPNENGSNPLFQSHSIDCTMMILIQFVRNYSILMLWPRHDWFFKSIFFSQNKMELNIYWTSLLNDVAMIIIAEQLRLSGHLSFGFLLKTTLKKRCVSVILKLTEKTAIYWNSVRGLLIHFNGTMDHLPANKAKLDDLQLRGYIRVAIVLQNFARLN